MMHVTGSVEVALADFDREKISAKVAVGEELRRDLLHRFPRDHWPEMTLED
jgi:hypothetical protein